MENGEWRMMDVSAYAETTFYYSLEHDVFYSFYLR